MIDYGLVEMQYEKYFYILGLSFSLSVYVFTIQ